MQTQAVSLAMPKPIGKSHRCRAEIRAVRELQAEYALILEGFNRAQNDLRAARINFEHISEPKAVDVCIYQIQYAQSRCDNLYKQLKALHRRIKNFDAASV